VLDSIRQWRSRDAGSNGEDAGPSAWILKWKKQIWIGVLPSARFGSHFEYECEHACAYTHICKRKFTQGSVNQLVKCTLIQNVNFFNSECTCKIVPNGILHFQCWYHNAAIPYYDLPGITVLAFPWIWEYISNYLTFQPHSFLLSLPLFWLLQSMKVKIKGKVFPTNPMKSQWESKHSSTPSQLQYYIEASGQPQNPATSSPGKSLWYAIGHWMEKM